MIKFAASRFLTAFVAAAAVLSAAPVSAQYLNLTPTVVNDAQTFVSEPGDTFAVARPSLFKPFTDALADFRRLPNRTNAEWLIAGVILAAGAHTADHDVTPRTSATRNGTFRAGPVIGGTPFELGAAFATYAIGRSTNSPRAMSFGSDLIRAQVMAEILTTGIKQGARRSRPEGSGFSFPSGHTTVTFASATVIQRHFGWKFGAPAYAVASYVAASRVEMRRHYLSDVAFGAALGIIAGRTVTIGREHTFALTPISALNGSGVGAGLTWVGRH